MTPFRRYRVSLVTSNIIPLSAVGNIQNRTYEALSDYARKHNMSLDVKTYSAYSGADAPFGHTVKPCTIVEMLADEHFQSSNIVLFTFCGSSPLIDALPFVPKGTRKAVFYHGITRPHLCPEAAEYLELGYKQAIILNEADMVFVASNYIADDVHSFGVSRSRIYKVPLFPEPPITSIVPLRETAHKKIRLLFLSRFCSAKGVVYLFDALKQWNDNDWTLDLICNVDFSDKNLLTIYQKLAKQTWKGRVRWHSNVDEHAKQELLEDADILVMPSLHEGFSVPLIEALGKGCALVCSDAGSIPEVSGGLGLVYPAYDALALTQCLEKAAQARRQGLYACTSGNLCAEKWREHAQAHVDFYSLGNFEERLCPPLFDGLPQKYGNLVDLLAERRVATLNSLGFHARPVQDVPQYMVDAVYEALAPTMRVAAEQSAPHGDHSHSFSSCSVELQNSALWPLVQKAEKANDEVLAVYNSLSWRITSPLRGIKTFCDALKISIGLIDPLRLKSLNEWELLVRNAQSADDWQAIVINRNQQLHVLHESVSWKVTNVLRSVYALSSKVNLLRKVYAIILRKPYIPFKYR